MTTSARNRRSAKPVIQNYVFRPSSREQWLTMFGR